MAAQCKECKVGSKKQQPKEGQGNRWGRGESVFPLLDPKKEKKMN